MNKRDAYYDNAKFFLIFLVVFGHFIQSYIHEDIWIHTLYTTIYTFHMPAFILISGFFAKGFHKKGYIGKITKKLIIPYLIFQGVYSIYYYFIGRSSIDFDPFNPEWSLWYLMSLFCWNIMLFVFSKWRAGISLVLAVALGVFVGYFDEINSFLSLSRTFVFFPFFLLGYYFKVEYFERIKKLKYRYASIIILVSVYVVYFFIPDFDYKWLFGSRPYDELDFVYIDGGLIRLGVYGLATISLFSFLALIPQNRYFFTKWGTSSIYVYLLHGFFIQYFRNSGLEGILTDTAQILLLTIISFGLVALLSSKVMTRITRPFIEPKLRLDRIKIQNK